MADEGAGQVRGWGRASKRPGWVKWQVREQVRGGGGGTGEGVEQVREQDRRRGRGGEQVGAGESRGSRL